MMSSSRCPRLVRARSLAMKSPTCVGAVYTRVRMPSTTTVGLQDVQATWTGPERCRCCDRGDGVPQRDSNERTLADHRRNESAKRGTTRPYDETETDGADKTRVWATAVRGQLRARRGETNAARDPRRSARRR